MGWRIALTDEAEDDLGNLVAFLAKKNTAAAQRIGLEIVGLIFALDELPHRGASMKRWPQLRKIAHRYYLIIYRIDEAQRLVEIVRIWDARQNPRNLEIR